MIFIFGFQIDWEQALGVLALFFLKKMYFIWLIQFFFVPLHCKTIKNRKIMKKVNKNRRVIWSNDDFDEWLKCMIADMEENETEDDFDEERYGEDCSIWLHDERSNLNIPIDGCIVCFAVLDLWDGHHNGAKIIGNNIKNILHGSCGDYTTWFCDRFNARCEDTHHDGTNTYLYRIAKNREQAEKLVDKIAYEDMTEEEFRKATRSVRPFIAKVYGW